MTEYPDDAYAPDGLLWWEEHDQKVLPNTNGAVPRMAAWLRWNVQPGERFSTQDLRRALGNSRQEHFQRRQRELKDYGWKYISAKEDPSLGKECELIEHGWWPGLGPRPKRGAISERVRRQVFKRDGQCQICGLGPGDLYDDGSPVVLTAGHIVPNSHGGAATLDNLQAECRHCNESARADTGTVADPRAVIESIRNLKKAERTQLLAWLRAGRRQRTQLDHVYTYVYQSGPAAREAALDYLTAEENRDGGREARR